MQQRTVNTVGGVVKPGETLMRIVPDQRRLVVEAYLPSKDVGRVRAGQKAEIKLEAFNFTLYGTLPGVVESVSASAVETPARPDAPQQAPLPPASAGAERHYAVRVGLERGAMVVEKGETVPLLPGMVATVEVKIGERRIIQYLLSPLIRVAKEGLREW